VCCDRCTALYLDNVFHVVARNPLSRDGITRNPPQILRFCLKRLSLMLACSLDITLQDVTLQLEKYSCCGDAVDCYVRAQRLALRLLYTLNATQPRRLFLFLKDFNNRCGGDPLPFWSQGHAAARWTYTMGDFALEGCAKQHVPKRAAFCTLTWR
jgi:hypothetical protein